MCMVVGLALDGCGVLATDLRVNRYYTDGSAHREDPGGKLASFPGGFIAGTGDGLMIAAVLAAVRERQPEDLFALQRLVADVYRTHAASIAAALPDADPDHARLLVVRRQASGFQVCDLAPTGRLIQARAVGSFIMSWPPELPDDDPRQQAIKHAFLRGVASARTADDIVAVLQRLFGSAGGLAESMSSSFDLGILTEEEQFTNQLRAASPGSSAKPTASIGFDLGTMTAGTISAGIIVATDKFTAANPVFDGVVAFKGGLGLVASKIGSTGSIAWQYWTTFGLGSDGTVWLETQGGGGSIYASSAGTTKGNKVIEMLSGPKIGFLGAAAIVRPTIGGSRGGIGALASLLSGLESLGLINDSTY